MMHVFVDTSAFLTLLDTQDANHVAASATMLQLIQDNAALVTTNYVLVETCAVLQRRFGVVYVRTFLEQVVPLLELYWVEQSIHVAGVAALLAANQRLLSLVDCVSFAIARQRGVDAVFAYDEHFADQGFRIL